MLADEMYSSEVFFEVAQKTSPLVVLSYVESGYSQPALQGKSDTRRHLEWFSHKKSAPAQLSITG